MGFFSKRTMAIIGIGLGLMAEVMAWSIVNTSLSSIQQDLSASILQLQWVMNSLGIFLCVPLLAMGKLGDMYGRKLLFLLGLIGSTIASLGAGMASHIETVIGWQALFGFSGSAILPLSQALLVHQFPETKKGKAVALWGMFVSIALAIGPLLGGLITHFIGWRWIFFMNIPILLLALLFAGIAVKKQQPQKVDCDWGGVISLAIIVGSLVVGIMQGPTWGWLSYPILGLFCLTLIGIILFTVLQKKAKAPLFRPDLFLKPAFLRASISNATMIGFFWGIFFFIPLFIQNQRGLSALTAGLTLLLISLPIAFFSVLINKLEHKTGAKPLILSGFALLIIATVLLLSFSSSDLFWPLALSCLLMGLGWVISWGPSISFALSSISHQLAGIASGMFTTMQEVGAVVAFSLAGVVFRVAHNNVLEPHMKPISSALRNTSNDQMQALLANPTASAQYLGAKAKVLPWIQNAFQTGYHDALWFLLALIVIGALFAISLPRKKSLR